MTRICSTCLYGKHVYFPDRGADVERCFRPRMMTDGRFVECGPKGFDAEAERGVEVTPGRLPGDLCGPAGKHWRPQP